MTFSMVMHATLSIKHIHNILIPNASHLEIWEATTMQQKNRWSHKVSSFLYIYISRSVYLSIYVSMYLSMYLSISVYLYNLFIYLRIYQHIYIYIYIYIYQKLKNQKLDVLEWILNKRTHFQLSQIFRLFYITL